MAMAAAAATTHHQLNVQKCSTAYNKSIFTEMLTIYGSHALYAIQIVYEK